MYDPKQLVYIKKYYNIANKWGVLALSVTNWVRFQPAPFKKFNIRKHWKLIVCW